MSSLTLKLGASSYAISPTLFGIFLEDLNHAIEGGLYAELVKNRSFNHPDRLSGWTLLMSGEAEGTMGLGFNTQPKLENPWYLHLTCLVASPGRVALANEGFWGVPVRAGAAYQLTVDAWSAASYAGAIVVTLESLRGDVLAQAQLASLPREKTRLTCGSRPTRPTRRRGWC